MVQPRMLLSGVLLLLPGAAAQTEAEAVPAAPTAEPKQKYIVGNAVADRNYPPPPGCTAQGQIYAPLTHEPLTDVAYTTQIAWDWCQSACRKATLPQLDGSTKPCVHFAFFPDGTCYFQDDSATLQPSPNCTAASPCEHGFQVIAGPASCKERADWVSPDADLPEDAVRVIEVADQAPPMTLAPTVAPPTVAPPTTAPPTTAPASTTAAPTAAAAAELPTPTAAAELPTPAAAAELPTPTAAPVPMLAAVGEECNMSLAEAVPCEAGLVCKQPKMVGASGVCAKPEATVVGEGEVCNPSLPPAFATVCEDGFACRSDPPMPGAAGTCTRFAEAAASEEAAVDGAATAAAVPKVAAVGETCNPTLPPQFATLCVEGAYCKQPKMLGAEGICTEGAAPTEVLVARDLPVPAVAAAEEPPANATLQGYYYMPQTMDGTAKLMTTSWQDCHVACVANPNCEHFAYWPDGGCHQQSSSAKLVKANCKGKEACAGNDVITGSRDFSDKKTWPMLSAAFLGSSGAPEVTESSLGGGWGARVYVIVLGLPLLVGLAYVAYTTGFIHRFMGEDDPESDVDAEEGADLKKVLAAE